MLVVYSQSRSFEAHIGTVVDGDVTFRSTLSPAITRAGSVYLVHGPSFSREMPGWLETNCAKGAVIAIAVDNPQIEDLLTYTRIGVKAYFNSYMAAPYYTQMLRLLESGQSWFPPTLITQVFDLARYAVNNSSDMNLVNSLTKRELEVALAVAAGKSNRLIATDCNISERTVKSHLTHIFKKLELSDRVALVIYMNQYGSHKAESSSAG